MADEVAEDYRQALEDLTVTSRVEIATLTNIARESAEHGLAIAKVLQEHIEKVYGTSVEEWAAALDSWNSLGPPCTTKDSDIC